MAKKIRIQIFGRTASVYELNFDSWLAGELTRNSCHIGDQVKNLSRKMAKIIEFLCDKGLITHEEIASLISDNCPTIIDA